MAAKSDQHEAVRREFTRQAAGFETEGSVFGDVAILEWIASRIDIPDRARILGVAGGTGQLGRYLARAGGSAVIVDLTAAMLASGLRAVLEHRQDNRVPLRRDRDRGRHGLGRREREIVLAALQQEADGGAATGLRARRTDGRLTITQRWMLVGD